MDLLDSNKPSLSWMLVATLISELHCCSPIDQIPSQYKQPKIICLKNITTPHLPESTCPSQLFPTSTSIFTTFQQPIPSSHLWHRRFHSKLPVPWTLECHLHDPPSDSPAWWWEEPHFTGKGSFPKENVGWNKRGFPSCTTSIQE